MLTAYLCLSFFRAEITLVMKEPQKLKEISSSGFMSAVSNGRIRLRVSLRLVSVRHEQCTFSEKKTWAFCVSQHKHFYILVFHQCYTFCRSCVPKKTTQFRHQLGKK